MGRLVGIAITLFLAASFAFALARRLVELSATAVAWFTSPTVRQITRETVVPGIRLMLADLWEIVMRPLNTFVAFAPYFGESLGSTATCMAGG